jgi:hypothetical protein
MDQWAQNRRSSYTSPAKNASDQSLLRLFRQHHVQALKRDIDEYEFSGAHFGLLGLHRDVFPLLALNTRPSVE